MSPLNRRSFLKSTALAGAALSFPSIIPASALGKDGTVAPSNRLQLVGIGLKSQGGGDMRQLMSKKGVQVIAICDVDRRVLKSVSAMRLPAPRTTRNVSPTFAPLHRPQADLHFCT